MPRSDGSVIIDTKLNTSGFSKGVSSLKGQFSALTSSVGKLGAAIGIAFSIKAIVDFSKKTLELGSDLQEVQNVVDVTFTTMNKQVNEFAKNATKTAGLSETMAKRYTGTFGAMAKSFGFTEAEAYNMSTALTQLSGDVASFYNLSQDAAYTKLKSVFTGETETLKDFGVVMTQTALDDFSLRKGLGKTTSQMSEQEKVALRYQFVLERLSSASGDFVRTQDGWANQTRLLKLQTESLLATLGQGLINVLTPAIKVFNTMISKLQEFATVFKQVTEVLFGNASAVGSNVGVADSLGDAAGNAKDLEGNITDAGKAAKKAFSGFDEINVLTAKAEESADGIGAALGTPSGKAEGPTDAKEESGISSGASKIASSLLDIGKKIQELTDPIKDFDLSPLSKSVKEARKSLGELGSTISSKLGKVWNKVLVPLGKWTIEKALPKLISTLSEAFRALGNVIHYFWPVFEDLWNNFLKPIAKWTGGIAIGALDLLSAWLKKIADHFDLSVPKAYKLSDAEKAIADKAKTAYKELENLQTQSEDTERAIETQYDDVKLLADELFHLADESGKVKDADKERANFILGKLNEALGTEYKMTGNIIENYQTMKAEIYDLISAKKANMLLDANTETYKNALLSQDTLYADREIKKKEYDAQLEASGAKLAELRERLAILKAGVNDFGSALYSGIDPSAISAQFGQYVGEISRIEKNLIPAQESAIAKAKASYEKAVAAYNNVFSIISEYDKASAMIAQGKYNDAITILSGYAARYSSTTDEIVDAAERERAALEEKVTNAGYYAQRLLEEFTSGSTSVTKEAVQAAINAYNEAIAQLEHVDTETARDLGNDFGTAFAEGISGAADTIQEELNAILGDLSMPSIWSVYGFGLGWAPRTPSIPHLAKGTVIPPNAPFMAVLGDQKHGTNIEAPLETIKQALAEVLAMQDGAGETVVNVNFTGDLSQLARVLKPAIDTETRRKGGSLATGGTY